MKPRHILLALFVGACAPTEISTVQSPQSAIEIARKACGPSINGHQGTWQATYFADKWNVRFVESGSEQPLFEVHIRAKDGIADGCIASAPGKLGH